jgi:hypothetical protein
MVGGKRTHPADARIWGLEEEGEVDVELELASMKYVSMRLSFFPCPFSNTNPTADTAANSRTVKLRIKHTEPGPSCAMETKAAAEAPAGAVANINIRARDPETTPRLADVTLR